MRKLSAWLTCRLSELGRERGATALEYSLIIILIAAVIVGAVTALGTDVSVIFANMAAAF